MQKTRLHLRVINIEFAKSTYLSCLFVVSFCFAAYSQQNNNNSKSVKSEVYQSLDPIEIAKLRNYDFQENFAVLLKSDKSNNYFFVDISKLPSEFAFKYFLYLATQAGNRIQTGHGLSDSKAWFIADNKNLSSDTLKQILSFKQSAHDKNSILSEKEKEDWVKLNNY